MHLIILIKPEFDKQAIFWAFCGQEEQSFLFEITWVKILWKFDVKVLSQYFSDVTLRYKYHKYFWFTIPNNFLTQYINFAVKLYFIQKNQFFTLKISGEKQFFAHNVFLIGIVYIQGFNLLTARSRWPSMTCTHDSFLNYCVLSLIFHKI